MTAALLLPLLLPLPLHALSVDRSLAWQIDSSFERNARLSPSDAIDNYSTSASVSAVVRAVTERWQHDLSLDVHKSRDTRQSLSSDGAALALQCARASEYGQTEVHARAETDDARFTLTRNGRFADELARQRSLAVGASQQLALSETRRVQANVDLSQVRHDDKPGAPFRDYSALQVQAAVEQDLSDNLTVGANAFVGRLDTQPIFGDPRGLAAFLSVFQPRLRVANDDRQDSLGAQVHALLQYSESLSVDATIGVRKQDERQNVLVAVLESVVPFRATVFTSVEHGHDVGLIGNVSARYQDENTDYSARVQREVAPSGLGSSNTVVSVQLSAQRSFSDRLRGAVTLRYQRTNTNEQFGNQRDYKYGEARVALSYQLDENLEVGGEYRFRHIDGLGHQPSTESDAASGHEFVMHVSWQDDRRQ